MNRKMYRKIAREYGVSIAEVKRDMNAAVEHAYKSPNLHARCVPAEGDTPTVDEVVAHAARRVKAIRGEE